MKIVDNVICKKKKKTFVDSLIMLPLALTGLKAKVSKLYPVKTTQHQFTYKFSWIFFMFYFSHMLKVRALLRERSFVQ